MRGTAQSCSGNCSTYPTGVACSLAPKWTFSLYPAATSPQDRRLERSKEMSWRDLGLQGLVCRALRRKPEPLSTGEGTGAARAAHPHTFHHTSRGVQSPFCLSPRPFIPSELTSNQNPVAVSLGKPNPSVACPDKQALAWLLTSGTSDAQTPLLSSGAGPWAFLPTGLLPRQAGLLTTSGHALRCLPAFALKSLSPLFPSSFWTSSKGAAPSAPPHHPLRALAVPPHKPPSAPANWL